MPRQLRPAVVAIAALLAAGAAAPPSGAHARTASGPLVDTTSGTLRGTADATTRRYQGVRFARPPVGELRWSVSRPPRRQQGIVDATRPGARCAQSDLAGAPSTAEDCLFLDVTVPRRVPHGQRLPVMVWWHGGGFTSGAGSDYDARRLADRGRVIVITPNKRLGIFGYLGLPGLRDGGTFGFSDQLRALRWTRDNAAAFGGDRQNVTVFGESDGAMAACALLTAPSAQGLYAKVAMSSGSCLLDWPKGGLLPGTDAQRPYVGRAASDSLGQATANELGCADVACLRALPAERLVPASIGFSNALTYGSRLLPTDPRKAVRSGLTTRVPLLSGGTEFEERSFIGGAALALPDTFTAGSYPTLLADAFGPAAAAKVAQQYPLSEFVSPADAFATVMSDAAWSCPTLTGQRILARRMPLYAFEFADPAAPNVNGIDNPEVPQGPTHATELPYLFDLQGTNLVGARPQARLSEQMIDLWTGFARDGRPHAAGVPEWPRFGGRGPVLRLEPRPQLSQDGFATQHRCAFWDDL